jgi:ectoine hydroxylase-related dioxygenase (phytanoyl-CoA dioxygenase family)
MIEQIQTIDSGYAIRQQCLSETECDTILNALSRDTIARSRAGARHLMANPIVSRLSTDDRLAAIARDMLGTNALPFRATLFEKSGETNWLIPWHQDTALPLAEAFDAPGWGPWSRKAGTAYAHAPSWALSRIVALRVHLDASTADNGPLRIVPGSHRMGVLGDHDVTELASKRDHVSCLVSRGGVLAMRPLLIHSSSKAHTADPRRVLHIEYADTLDLGPGIRLAVV